MSCAVCDHLGRTCAHCAGSHHLQGPTAPEETAIEKIEKSIPSIVAHSPSEDSYSNKGCREPDCRAAHAEYRRQQRRSRGVQERRRGRTHGSVGTYRNLPCRCALCREAAVGYQAEYRARGRMGK